jgi:hypothetical protein
MFTHTWPAQNGRQCSQSSVMLCVIRNTSSPSRMWICPTAVTWIVTLVRGS